MDRLKFYNIDDKYIEYLYQFDKNQSYCFSLQTLKSFLKQSKYL